MTADNSQERRRYPRFQVNAGSAALLTGNQIKLGKVLDISLGGAGFRYSGQPIGPLQGQTLRLDMLLHDHDAHFENVACRVVSDFPLPPGQAFPTQPDQRCCVEFLHLDAAQISQLTAELQAVANQEKDRRRHLEKELRQSEEKYRTILESIEEGYFEVDLAGNVIFFNNSMLKIVGYPETEALGVNYRQFTKQSTAERVFREYNKAYRTGKLPPPFDWEFVKKTGETIQLETSLAFIKNSENKVIGFRGIARDISSRKKFEQELIYLASHDQLTGLYNRNALFSKLRETIAIARRSGKQCALLFLDLDNFKKVNDTYDHQIGDCLLQKTASRLTALLRQTDAIGRHGGDEFTIILSNFETLDPFTVARKIIEKIAEDYHIDRHRIDFVSASIGISLFPDDGQDAEALIKSADEAMYQAKKRKNRYIYYNQGKFTD